MNTVQSAPFVVSFSQLSLGAVLALLVSITALRLRLLTGSGAGAAALLGTAVFGLGGLPWAIPLLVFFFTSSFLSRIPRDAQFDLLFDKSGVRDGGQVMANGGVGGILVVVYALTGDGLLYAAYLGTLVAVTADTWATEIGTRLKQSPVLITNFRRVDPGTPGGVSLVGTGAGIVGASLVALSGWVWIQPPELGVFGTIMVAAFVGMTLDSFAGATVQAQYRCSVCRKITERAEHCGQAAVFARGIRRITNDWVNLLCAASGALVVWLIRTIIFASKGSIC